MPPCAMENSIPPSQSTAMAFLGDQVSLWDERNLGWAVWGGMGFLDCRRPDAASEEFRGYRLDRKMYELMRAHTHDRLR